MFAMRFASRALLALLSGCAGEVPAEGPSAPDAADHDATGDAAAPDAPLALTTTSGTYRDQCDGSAGVALDFTHFVSFSDSDQVARVYARGAIGGAYRTVDLSATLGMAPGDDADFEDAAMIGSRIYVLGSHGRKNDGTLDLHRYRFAAIDVFHNDLSSVGSSESLLRDMLDATNWSTPDSAVIAALANASQLDQQKMTNLAPKTKPEGIVTYPGTKDIQILLDSDDVPAAGTTCDNASTSARSFADLIIHLE
jgi:hypothetical protein